MDTERTRPSGSQGGFTVVEVLVAGTLGLGLALPAFALLNGTYRIATLINSRFARDAEARQALTLLGEGSSSFGTVSDAQRQVSVKREERDGGVVAIVTLDNAARLNSMNSTLMAQLCEALATLAADAELRACVLTGAGNRAFVGGADIREMSGLREPNGARAFISRVHACCQAVRAVPVPVIARINGFCFGAGLELAATCDLRVAANTATFGMPEVRLGIPSVVEAALLPMLVGWGRTRQMLLLGETFDADTALRWGLVERTVPMAELDGAVDACLAALLDGRPRAIRLQKKLIGSWEDLPVRAAIQAGIDCFAAAYDTDEPERAMRDFLVAQAERKAKG